MEKIKVITRHFVMSAICATAYTPYAGYQLMKYMIKKYFH